MWVRTIRAREDDCSSLSVPLSPSPYVLFDKVEHDSVFQERSDWLSTSIWFFGSKSVGLSVSAVRSGSGQLVSRQFGLRFGEHLGSGALEPSEWETLTLRCW